MIEPEIAFADLKENMQIAEDMIKYVLRYVLEEAPAEMEFFDQFIFPGVKERAEKLVNSTFARVTYTEAILQKTINGILISENMEAFHIQVLDLDLRDS